MQLEDYRVIPGVVSVHVDGANLCLKYLVVVVQGLPMFLDDHQELNIALHDCYHALLPLLLVVDDAAYHLEEDNHILVALHLP